MFKYISSVLSKKDPIEIIPYGGYSNGNKLYCMARVLEDESIKLIEGITLFSKLKKSFKRFETDEIKNIKVIVSWGNEQRTVISDNEGYIYLETEYTGGNLNNSTSIPITFTIQRGKQPNYSVGSELLIPSSRAQFGIISDIDETILHTGLSSLLKWRMIVNTFATEASKRIPIEGSQSFYLKLAKGLTMEQVNPFFYLSNSPWNLYTYLMSFLKKFNFPKGVLLLRDFGIEHKRKKTFIEGNKFIRITHILKTFPKLPFILIGDAQDLDVSICLEISKNFPKQIMAIYIREVKSKKKMVNARKLAKEYQAKNIHFIKSTNEACEHAVKNKFCL